MKKDRYILGIQTFATPDPGACLLKVRGDGNLEYVALSEERLTRKKYAYVFPLLSIDYCLKHFGLEDIGQVDLLAADYIRLPRWEISGPAYNLGEFDYLKKTLNFPRERIAIYNHHLAHAAASYFFSPFEDAAVLIVDGNGSQLETQSFYKAENNTITEMEKYYYYGIGSCYSAVTSSILNFGVGGEGKTMGLAPYGEKCPPVMAIEKTLDGIATDYSPFIRRLPRSDVLNQIDPSYKQYPFTEKYRFREKDQDPLDPYFARVAWEIQDETEKVMVHLANELHRRFPSKNLALGGGVMLNCVVNKIILDKTPFENVFIFPGCGDTGVPVGVCLQAYYSHPMFREEPQTRVHLRNAYLGRSYTGDEISQTLEKYSIPWKPTSPDQVADLIAQGKIVAWFQGGSEFGPRALGHRSILADSRGDHIKDMVNDRVKHREGFRPFAPAVLLEEANKWFDLECDSPFMLLVAAARDPEKIPSVIHVDDSARVQTVTQEDNDAYFELIEAFFKKTGVPVILNTSFNIAGEPIVETPADALICGLGTAIDHLVLHDKLVDCSLEGREQLRERMIKDREENITQWRERVIRKNHPGYNKPDLEKFMAVENEMSFWWAKHRARYELGKKVMEWAAAKRRVAIVGEARHTAFVRRCTSDFDSLDVAAFMDIQPGEAPDFQLPYPRISWEALAETDPDVVLVSSWDHQYQIRDELKRRGWNKEVYLIYDEMGRSFEDVFPGFE